VIVAAIRRAGSSIAARPFQLGNGSANKNADTTVPRRQPKSVMTIRRDRNINFPIDNLTRHGNNRSAAELIRLSHVHPANNM
jgi:hypothetical protein